MRFSLETFSFVVGFITATVFWWLMARMRPLWAEIRENWKTSREEAKARRATGVEENHRRSTFRRAQGSTWAGMRVMIPIRLAAAMLNTPAMSAKAQTGVL